MVFDFSFFVKSFWNLWKAVPLTLEITIFGFALGFVLALGMAWVLMQNIRILTPIVRFIVSFNRGTPMMLQIYLTYYALPFVINLLLHKVGINVDANRIPVVVLVIFALGLNRAAFLTETIRSGLMAVGKGEVEAGYSIGMTTGMVFRFVIVPQMFRICLPNFSTNLINILHGSSLAFYVTLLEVTGTANILAESNWRYFETYLAAGGVYWILTIIIEVVTYMLERRLSRHEKAAVA